VAGQPPLFTLHLLIGEQRPATIVYPLKQMHEPLMQVANASLQTHAGAAAVWHKTPSPIKPGLQVQLVVPVVAEYEQAALAPQFPRAGVRQGFNASHRCAAELKV
jgi:hypothetical protein